MTKRAKEEDAFEMCSLRSTSFSVPSHYPVHAPRSRHVNHLGSSSVITDGNGDVKETMDYHPFGTYRDRQDLDTSFPNINYTFTGQEDDEETGLYNYNARLYDPELGRFISADSIIPEPGNLQAFNRYSYCINNPLVYIDPSGHFFGLDDWVVGMIVGAIIGAVFSGAKSDWDPQAMAIGAVVGGISGAVGGGVVTITNEALRSYGLSTVVQGAIVGAAGGAAGGAVAGGLSAAYYGGNVGDSMLSGAGYGALGGGAFGAIGYPNSLWKIGAYAAVGGGLSELSGGSFGDGALMVGALAVTAYGYYKLTDIGNGGRLPGGELSDGTAMEKTGDPKVDLTKMDANRNTNWFGHAGNAKTLNGSGHEGWGPFRWLTSHIPFANDIAYVHDFGADRILHEFWNPATCYGSMLPAAALTFGGAAVYYSPLTTGISFGMRDD